MSQPQALSCYSPTEVIWIAKNVITNDVTIDYFRQEEWLFLYPKSILIDAAEPAIVVRFIASFVFDNTFLL